MLSNLRVVKSLAPRLLSWLSRQTCCRQWRQPHQPRVTTAAATDGCRRFFFSSTAASASADSDPSAAITTCDIVKGPSLLQTSIHRPRPSLLHLPFWSQQHRHQHEDAKNTQTTTTTTRVAYQDPSLSWAVQHLEENWQVILQEYQKVAPTLASDYQVDTEHSLHKGTWDWHSYMLKGKLEGTFQQHFPQTSQILNAMQE